MVARAGERWLTAVGSRRRSHLGERGRGKRERGRKEQKKKIDGKEGIG